MRTAPDRGAHGIGKAALADASGRKFKCGHFGEYVGGINQRLFRRLTNARLGFAGKGVEDEPGGQTDDQEVTEKEADGDVHRSITR